jgi:hypothetical protein
VTFLQNTGDVPPSLTRRPGVIHTSLYLPEPVHEALRVAAFKQRRKIHDIWKGSKSRYGSVGGRADGPGWAYREAI